MADQTPSATGPEPVTEGSPVSNDEGRPQVVREYKGTGVFWILVAVFVPLVLLIVMLAQNAARVTFEFLWWDLHPPLYVIMLVTAAVAAALTEGLAAAWRHQRRRVRTERSELAALRATRSA